MKKPNFFILGAPKCGTTSVSAWLSQHPNIFMAPIKEPHFFNNDGLRRVKTLKHYESLFEDANPEKHKAVGEASVRYLFSKVAVPHILDYQPEAKLIICIRNPIEMSQSLHAQMLFVGYETEKDFEKAWSLQFERLNGRNIPSSVKDDPTLLQYGAYCKLGEQLDRVYNLVAEGRILTIVLDDLSDNPKEEYQKILSFLEVPDDGRKIFTAHNQRKGVRSTSLAYFSAFLNNALHRVKESFGIKVQFGAIRALRSLNKASPRKAVLSEHMKEKLAVFFKEDIHLLENLLKRDLSYWLE